MPETVKSIDVVYPDGWIRELCKGNRPPPARFEIEGGPAFDVVKQANGYYELVRLPRSSRPKPN
jgi:hypothetical protein